jgi:hypothetical protein
LGNGLFWGNGSFFLGNGMAWGNGEVVDGKQFGMIALGSTPGNGVCFGFGFCFLEKRKQ